MTGEEPTMKAQGAVNINVPKFLMFSRDSTSITVILILFVGMVMTGCVANINRPDSSSTTPLMWAAQEGNLEKVKSLVAQGADLNARNKNGVSVLFHTVYYKQAEVARYLIEKGAKPANEVERVQIDQMLGISTGSNPAAEKPSFAAVKSDIDEIPAIKANPHKNSYAIVIGIERYRQKLPRADYATHDAQTMTAYLTKVLGYPEENVITLLNDHASNVDLAKYFEKWLPNNVEKGGTVFVYYSGHGAPDPKSGSAYLVPYDGDPSFIDETGYSLKRMYAALGKLPAKEIIVALDSCFSGAGGRSVIAKGSRPLVMNMQSGVLLPKNITVLSASSGDQTSSTYDEKGHGLFTYFLLKGIKNEDVTRPDGSLRIDDLYSYVKPQVERIARKQYNNEQTPQLIEPKK